MVYQCGLRLAARLKSGGPSLGRSPGAHKQRRPVNQDQIQLCGEIGSTQFLEQGFSPCSFFFAQGFSPCFFSRCLKKSESALLHDAAATTTSNLIHRSFELAAERCEDLTPRVQGIRSATDALIEIDDFTPLNLRHKKAPDDAGAFQFVGARKLDQYFATSGAPQLNV
jgi:hypothetical protein